MNLKLRLTKPHERAAAAQLLGYARATTTALQYRNHSWASRLDAAVVIASVLVDQTADEAQSVALEALIDTIAATLEEHLGATTIH